MGTHPGHVMPSTVSTVRCMLAVNSPSAAIRPVKYCGQKRKMAATTVAVHSMILLAAMIFERPPALVAAGVRRGRYVK